MPADLLDLVRAKVGSGFERPIGSRGEYHGPCPSCGGKDRFHVFPDQAPNEQGIAGEAGAPGGYWCRSCGLAGDYVGWLREVEGWDWKKIRDSLGVGEGGERRPAADAPRPARREPEAPKVGRELADLQGLEFPPDLWMEHGERFADECAAHLAEHPGYVAWLERRGIPLAVAQAWGLGWHQGEPGRQGPPCAYRDRSSWGLPPRESASRPGRQKPLWFPRGLVIPKRRDGRLLGLRIRRERDDLAGGGAKYIQVEGSRAGCFLSSLDARAYLVVEAQLCALAVIAAAVPDVGVCAIESLQAYPDAEAAAALSQAAWIGLCLDFEPSQDDAPGDKSGARMKDGLRARSWWLSRFPRCERLPVPLGKDVGDFCKRAGLGALRTWIEGQLPPVLRPNALAPRGRVERAPSPATSEAPADVPDDVLRLDALMRETRVPLHNGPEAYGLDLEAVRRQPSWEVFSEMSDLLTQSRPVSDWLSSRKPGRILPGRLLIAEAK